MTFSLSMTIEEILSDYIPFTFCGLKTFMRITLPTCNKLVNKTSVAGNNLGLNNNLPKL